MPETQDSRIRNKRATSSGVIATVPVSSDHTDGTWIDTDIYIGELFLNQVDDKLYIRTESGIKLINFTAATGPGVLIAVSGTLSTAEILAINTTPIEAIAAQGANTQIEIISSSAKLRFNSAAYVLAGGDLSLHETNVAGTRLLSTIKGLDNLLDEGATQRRRLQLDNQGTTLIILENVPIVWTVNVGDPITGDSPVDWFILYRVITVLP